MDKKSLFQLCYVLNTIETKTIRPEWKSGDYLYDIFRTKEHILSHTEKSCLLFFVRRQNLNDHKQLNILLCICFLIDMATNMVMVNFQFTFNV